MKILLVNNNTIHLPYIERALAGHNVETIEYQPGADFNELDKDLVILSGGGGEGREANDTLPTGQLWYHDEIEFILRARKPVLGICMGFELICQAYGSRIEQLAAGHEGPKAIRLAGGQRLTQTNSHDWYVPSVPHKDLEVVADSTTGVEIVKHKTRPILGTQFHPELPGSWTLPDLAKVTTS